MAKPGTHGKPLKTANDIIAFLNLWKDRFYYREIRTRLQEIIEFIKSRE